MANDVLNINVETKVKTKSTKVKTTTKKNSPSLFDQMISKNASKNKETKISETKQNDISSNTKEKHTSELNKKQVSKAIKGDTNISLFDKLKKSNKDVVNINNKDENKKIIKKDDNKTVSLFDNLKNKNKNKNTETNAETKTKTEKEIKKQVTIPKNKNDLKIKTSLFDNLKNKNNETKVDKVTTSQTKIDTIKVSSTIKDKIERKNEESNLKVDTLKQNIDISNISLNNNINENNIKSKELNNKPLNSKIINNINKNSLLDNLVNNIKKEKLIKKENVELNIQNKVQIKDKLSAKTFLSNQNTKATIISKQHILEAKKILLNENTKDAKSKIINSAKTLELGAKNVEIVNEDKSIPNITNINKIDSKVQEQNTFLNKVLFTQALNIQNNKVLQDIKIVKKANELETITKEIKSEDIQIKESSSQTAIQNITNKIISARQNMKSFMSDMARKMYENYKPPVTAFKINLNPAHLGSISIIMKSEKATNSISISMSASQGSTLEVLEGAKSLLQNSLLKTFDSQSNFSLDFSQQDNQSNMQDNQNNKQNSKGKSNTKEEIEDIIENDISIYDGYM